MLLARKMLIILMSVVSKIVYAEGRVFCQDKNAYPWKPLGLPCPITCSTIVTAVDRLKFDDYQLLLNETVRNKINISAMDLYTIGQQLQENIVFGRKSNALQPDIKKHLKLYNTYRRLLNNDKFAGALKKELSRMSAELKNGMCAKMARDKRFYVRMKSNKCAPLKTQVLETFTEFLNKYADPKYPFDDDMTEIILQKLEGRNLRYGEVDFKKILAYLRKALKFHWSKTKGDQVIELQASKNCLTIYLPGCYCKVGFVENNGQCVKPEDCIPNTVFTEYIERVILH